MRIAVDAMGGDHGPATIVAGALDGARRAGVGLTLVGQTDMIQAALATHDQTGIDIEVLDAPDVIGMDQHPAQAVRRLPNASILVACRAASSGSAGAVVSAGNSGAAMAAALLVLGRIPGIDRPAIASFVPSERGRTLLLDLGAVTDPRPAHLVQFARMGSAYAERVGGIASPTVGLLSNGEEPTKGNQLVQETFPLLAALAGIDFYGNVEGTDITQGVVDVVVTDGFTGNVALKVAEGVGALVVAALRSEVTATLPRKLAALLLRPAFRAVGSKLDYSETGGAALLGVNGAVVIAHGRSDAKAIANAVLVAHRAASQEVVAHIGAAIAAPLGAANPSGPATPTP